MNACAQEASTASEGAASAAAPQAHAHNHSPASDLSCLCVQACAQEASTAWEKRQALLRRKRKRSQSRGWGPWGGGGGGDVEPAASARAYEGAARGEENMDLQRATAVAAATAARRCVAGFAWSPRVARGCTAWQAQLVGRRANATPAWCFVVLGFWQGLCAQTHVSMSCNLVLSIFCCALQMAGPAAQPAPEHCRAAARPA